MFSFIRRTETVLTSASLLLDNRCAEDQPAALKAFLLQRGQNYIDWYRRKKRPRQLFSRGLRLLALSLFLLGGLCPLLPSPFFKIDIQRAGYFLLALAGGLLTCDRLFGTSASWMRYIRAAQTIEERMDILQVDWLRTASFQINSETASLDRYLELSESFLRDLHGIVKQETEVWVSEFRSDLLSFQSIASAQTDVRSFERPIMKNFPDR